MPVIPPPAPSGALQTTLTLAAMAAATLALWSESPGGWFCRARLKVRRRRGVAALAVAAGLAVLAVILAAR